jgi:hypothetical protein
MGDPAVNARPTDIEWLATWYERQCDGDWEHSYCVKIDTLDNPGWSLAIDLVDTNLEGKPFEEVSDLEPERDWIHCEVQGSTWRGAAGPRGLSALIRTFRQWVEAKP